MDDQALTPDTFELPTLDAEPIAAVEEQVVEAATQDDKELAALNMSRGWHNIADTMKTDIDNLRTMKAADLAGLPMEKVGEKFLVSSLVADHLQNYLDKVEHATKSVVEHERKAN